MVECLVLVSSFQPVLHDRYNKGCGMYYLVCGMVHIKVHDTWKSRTEETTKAGTCAHDRHALQQLALNVHVKYSDLT